jgi:hypothetical protein
MARPHPARPRTSRTPTPRAFTRGTSIRRTSVPRSRSRRQDPRTVLLLLLVALALAFVVPGALGTSAPDAAPTATVPSGPAPAATAEAPSTAPDPSPSAAPHPSPAATPAAGTALAAVDLLGVKGRAPRTGYERDLFGEGWVDVDRNGCDTRNDVLARDLTDVTYKPGTRDCVVLSGTLADPYSGTTIEFLRGQDTSPLVQIDHVVALADAWQKGAQAWDEATRVVFANDPLNLLAVDGALNRQKGSGDAATWLPPNRGFRCAYVARQVAVKLAYGLWVTPAERDAMVRVLSACPDEPLPAADDAVAPAR